MNKIGLSVPCDIRTEVLCLVVVLASHLFIAETLSAVDIQPGSFDSSGLAAAIRQAAPGDTVRLSTGTFKISEPVLLKSGVKLIGAGQGKTRIVYAGSKPVSLMEINECHDVEVAHMTLDGRDNPLVRDGITGGNSHHLFIHHISFCKLGKGVKDFSHGIIFSGRDPTMENGVTDSTISDCRFERIGMKAEYGGGIRLAWGCLRNRVERNVISDTGRGGIFGDHSPELVIRENRVSGSGGEGLGIEIWGGCPRSVIEDNVIDHWISVDKGDQSAVRRNVIGTDDGTLKYIGIEIIARDVVVTDNVIKRGAFLGLSVSNKQIKNNVFWGYNVISDCTQWGAQLQGETGGIARHYFYRCDFERTVRGDKRAPYDGSGHGFRFNGSARELVFEECAFRRNGGYGVEFGGADVDHVSFLRCEFKINNQGAVTGVSPDMTVGFSQCRVAGDNALQLPLAKAFTGQAPAADFSKPEMVRAGVAARFECRSSPGIGRIAERIWDFGHGIPEITANPVHTYERPGKYRVTLIVWDAGGRGARVEKTIEVMADK